jgi:hypothetical protein
MLLTVKQYEDAGHRHGQADNQQKATPHQFTHVGLPSPPS